MSESPEPSDPVGYARGLLVGERVRLRPLVADDLSHLARWWNDPEQMVLQQGSVLPRGTEAAEELFRSWSADNGSSGVGYSVVDHDGRLLGHVTLWGITAILRIATLGIIIGPEHVGQGYGTDAVRVAQRLAFGELGVNKIELRVWSFNDRALHMYRKVGFVVEGRRRAAVYHRSAYADEILMGMLRSEYEAIGRPPA